MRDSHGRAVKSAVGCSVRPIWHRNVRCGANARGSVGGATRRRAGAAGEPCYGGPRGEPALRGSPLGTAAASCNRPRRLMPKPTASKGGGRVAVPDRARGGLGSADLCPWRTVSQGCVRQVISALPSVPCRRRASTYVRLGARVSGGLSAFDGPGMLSICGSAAGAGPIGSFGSRVLRQGVLNGVHIPARVLRLNAATPPPAARPHRDSDWACGFHRHRHSHI